MNTSILKLLPKAERSTHLGWPWNEETNTSLFNEKINYPKITIITPSYNQGNFIEETIRSILLQNYPNLEYFIFDGGSTDNSIEIIKKYEKFITYVESKKDNGQSHAINKGLSIATGDIITWLNSDDFYNPGTLFRVAHEFIENINYNCVIGKVNVFGNDKSFIIKSPLFTSIEKTIGYGRIVQPAMFFKAATYKQIGHLNEKLHYLIDTEWWLKYLMHYKLDRLIEIESTLVNFRLHSVSKTFSQNDEFIKERDTIYFSIAKINKLDKLAEVINYFKLVDKDYLFNSPLGLSTDEIEKSLNYFLLLRGNEFYVQLDRKNAEYCFKHINQKLLLREDVVFLKKLIWRNKYIPKTLIEIFRKK